MTLLITNDDGVHAPGLSTLVNALPAKTRYIIVAPDRQRSECSHTATTKDPIHIVQQDPLTWAIGGTPVDCVRIGLGIVAKQIATEITGVISGVNDGANLGVDVFHSGTVAAAREAAIHGIPAMALSQLRHPTYPRLWDHIPRWLGEDWLADFFGTLDSQQRYAQPHTACFWNVNFPADPSISRPESKQTTVDLTPMPYDYRSDGDDLQYLGNYHQRKRNPGTDVTACFGGCISISRVAIALS